MKTSDDQTGWVFGGFTIGEEDIHAAWINRVSGASYKKSETEEGVIPYRARVGVISFSRKGYNRLVNVRWNSVSVTIDERDLSFIPIPEYIPGFNPGDATRYQENINSYHEKMLNRFNGSSGEIRERFGPLLGYEDETMENRHGGNPLSIVTYRFRGIEATCLKGNKGMFYLQAARITSGKCFGGFPVTIGMEIKDVYAYLGIPWSDWGSYVVYTTGYSPAMVCIYHRNGKVTEIMITNYAD